MNLAEYKNIWIFAEHMSLTIMKITNRKRN